MQTKEFSDKTAVITGGASGLGRAIAEAFSMSGAEVTILDREMPKGRVDTGMRFVQCDISRAEDRAKLLGDGSPVRPRIDYLILNAAVYRNCSVRSLNQPDLDAVFSVNVFGHVLLATELSDLIVDGGAILAIGSTASKSTQPGEAIYRASKLALRGFVESFALELSDRKVRANMLSPGAIATDFSGAALMRDLVRSQIPLGREASRDEMARLALFLCSDAAQYLTGTEIVVDGGLSLRPIRSTPGQGQNAVSESRDAF